MKRKYPGEHKKTLKAKVYQGRRLRRFTDMLFILAQTLILCASLAKDRKSIEVISARYG